MRITNSMKTLSVLAAALSVMTVSPALAGGSGGTGGGGLSSGGGNVPQVNYNPVQDYQDGLAF